jgi:monoamine oxidase
LFGFVGLAAGSPMREPSRLLADAVHQLEKMYGAAAAKPLDVILKDWSLEEYTATEADQLTSQHPRYGIPPGMAALAGKGLLFASSEMAPQFGGFIEGALEASQNALSRLQP